MEMKCSICGNGLVKYDEGTIVLNKSSLNLFGTPLYIYVYSCVACGNVELFLIDPENSAYSQGLITDEDQVCPKCQTVCLKDCILCPGCGYNFNQTDISNFITCKHCKQKYEDIYDYCPYCGHKIESNYSQF